MQAAGHYSILRVLYDSERHEHVALLSYYVNGHHVLTPQHTVRKTSSLGADR